MFVGDMSLEEAREWEKDLAATVFRLSKSLTGSQSPALEQAGWDLEDVRERIAELEA